MTDPKLCLRCKYRGTLDGHLCCDYAWLTGKTKLKLPKREDGLCPAFEEGEELRMEFNVPGSELIRVTRAKPMIFDGALMRELYDKGMSDGEIAKKVGCSKSCVYNWRKRNGLKHNAPAPSQLPKFNRHMLRLLYDRGLTDKEIAKRMGCGTTTVTRWRQKQKLPCQKVRMLQYLRRDLND